MENNTPRLFKTAIPDEVFLQFVRAIGLQSLSDTRWITTTEIKQENINKINILRQTLDPYIQQHKKYILNRPFDGCYMCIRLIRQIAKSKGYRLESKECKDKTSTGRKTSMYRLISNSPLAPAESFIVSFN
jgi:hypothetical protein